MKNHFILSLILLITLPSIAQVHEGKHDKLFDDFLMENGLKVLNANSSMISSNPFDDHYRVYFLSDSQTIAVFWINSI